MGVEQREGKKEHGRAGVGTGSSVWDKPASSLRNSQDPPTKRCWLDQSPVLLETGRESVSGPGIGTTGTQRRQLLT